MRRRRRRRRREYNTCLCFYRSKKGNNT